MQFLKNLFGGAKLDGAALAASPDLKEYAQVALLAHFLTPQPLHDVGMQGRWSRVLPRSYADDDRALREAGLAGGRRPAGYAVTADGPPLCRSLRASAPRARKAEARQHVHDALAQMMTSEALTIAAPVREPHAAGQGRVDRARTADESQRGDAAHLLPRATGCSMA